MEISKIRERIKNINLFNNTAFDSTKEEDCILAEKIAGNATIALVDFLKEELKTNPEITVQEVINRIEKDNILWTDVKEYQKV